MRLRVTDVSEVKYFRYGAEAKAILNRELKLAVVDAKPSELPLARLKYP